MICNPYERIGNITIRKFTDFYIIVGTPNRAAEEPNHVGCATKFFWIKFCCVSLSRKSGRHNFSDFMQFSFLLINPTNLSWAQSWLLYTHVLMLTVTVPTTLSGARTWTVDGKNENDCKTYCGHETFFFL